MERSARTRRAAKGTYEVASRRTSAPNFTDTGFGERHELIIESMAIQTPWYWRVRAADGAGNIGDWSAVSTFTLGVDGGSPLVNYIRCIQRR